MDRYVGMGKNLVLKRFLDIVLSIFLIIGLLPLMIAISFLVFLKIGSPVLFRQQRPGKNGKVFTIYKFRTMLDMVDADGKQAEDRDRLTAYGRFLRSTSLDELPELFNVLKGEMSFVGPRPLLVEYLELYTPEQARRHEVKPGITGWAQINGRNAITWDEKFVLDVWYVENWSLWLDIKILFLTVIKVIKKEGITQENHATMGKFKG